VKTLVFADFDRMGGTRTYLKRLVEYLTARSSVVVVARRRMFDAEIVRFLRERCIRIVRLGEPEKVTQVLRRLLTERVYDGLARRMGKTFSRTGLPSLLSMVREYSLMKRLVEQIEPDLVFVSQGGGPRYFAALGLDAPMVFTTHSLMPTSPIDRSCMKFLLSKVTTRNLLRKRIVCDSESARRNLVRHLRPLRAGGICRHLHNHGGSLSETPRRREGRIVSVLTLGHVTGYKNPELWIRIAKEVTRRSKVAIQFSWTGDGNLLKKCREATKNEKNIRFLGFVEDVEVYYEQADIYFQPSELENHPISVVEAMKWSIPCVVSSVGGLPECVEDQGSGFVVDTSDFEMTVQRIQSLAEDAQLRRKFGSEGRRRFETMFSSETWTASMDGLISEVSPSWRAQLVPTGEEIAAAVGVLRRSSFFQRSDFSAAFLPNADDLGHWRDLALGFEKFQSALEGSTNDQIPRLIHQIWLGGRLPGKYVDWTKSWERLNAGWHYHLWDEEAIVKIGLVNERAFRKSPSLGAKSDLARYEILFRFGGVYADTDFECLRPLDGIVSRCSFFAGVLNQPSPSINNALMGSVPGHPLLRHLLTELSEPVVSRDGMSVISTSGASLLSKVFFQRLPAPGHRDVVFPSTYFYPVPNSFRAETINAAVKAEYVKDWSLALHYWEGSWMRPHPARVFLSRIKHVFKHRVEGREAN
jgi:inositol phosphorylceramide mannosyltransferase catalytic subunit